MERHRTPFPAIVGQEALKRTLLAVATNDALDGLLVRGEKGTAKSTAVRALVDLLPEQRAIAECPYGCPPHDPSRQCETCRSRRDFDVETRPVPLVTLPLGATRDRVVGTLSVADALDGDAAFDPGLLARANRGILYVDEVNLLDDHLVDVILDAAASRVNHVERDGVSVEHPAAFTLVGTMNPEEGDLRPQLRDRFALQATVTGCRDVDDRVTVIDRALERHDDPSAFKNSYDEETDVLRDRLRTARDLVETVSLPAEFRVDIAELCRNAGVDGHRADIAIARTAMTLAALEGRTKVISSDVREAATYALPHRLRRRPFDESPEIDDVLDDHFDDEPPADGDGGADEDADDGRNGDPDGERQDDATGDESLESDSDEGQRETCDDETGDGGGDCATGNGDREGDHDGGEGSPGPTGRASQAPAEGASDDEAGASEDGGGESPDSEAMPLLPGQERVGVGDSARPPVEDIDVESETTGRGERARVASSADGRGPRVRTEHAAADDEVDGPASVRAAAAEGRTRVEKRDLRTAVRSGRAGTLVVFVVDASASMRPAMREAKGTVMSLLRDAYEQRDEVAFVAVAGEDATVLLPPTNSTTLAARHLKELPIGDRTPLADGLGAAHRLVTRADAEASLVVVVTDGRANVADGSPTEATRSAARQLAMSDASVVLVDAGDDGTGLTDVIETETDGRRISLAELTAERVAHAAASAHET